MIKEINPGDELTFDYRWEVDHNDNHRMACKCGVTGCHGFIEHEKTVSK
jgi:SET domain-containing protein